jgi:hypothetical protein
MNTQYEEENMLKMLLETQARHGEKLENISSNVHEIKEGITQIQKEGLQHLKDIAVSSKTLSETLRNFSLSDELKVNIIKGQGLNSLLTVLVLLAFVIAVFAIVESYDIRVKHRDSEMGLSK